MSIGLDKTSYLPLTKHQCLLKDIKTNVLKSDVILKKNACPHFAKQKETEIVMQIYSFIIYQIPTLH